jgi:hypothetical protein
VERKAKIQAPKPKRVASNSERPSRSRARGSSSSSPAKTPLASIKSLGKRKADALLDDPQVGPSSRPQINQAPPFIRAISPIPPALPPPTTATCSRGASSLRAIPVPPAKASVLGLRWNNDDFESVVGADPVATAFENERLRDLVAACYQDMELERARHTRVVASYETELRYWRDQVRKQREKDSGN